MTQPDEGFDYEALPSNASLSASLLAGAFAGIAEHAIMYPVDSIKVIRKKGRNCSAIHHHRNMDQDSSASLSGEREREIILLTVKQIGNGQGVVTLINNSISLSTSSPVCEYRGDHCTPQAVNELMRKTSGRQVEAPLGGSRSGISSLHDQSVCESLKQRKGFHSHSVTHTSFFFSHPLFFFFFFCQQTRMQIIQPTPQAVYSGVINAISKISTTEGAKTLWRGVNSVILGAGPAHALYFGTYEVAKHAFGGNESGHHPIAAGNDRVP